MGVVLKFYWYVLLSIEFVSRHFLIRMSWQDYVDKNLVGTGKVKKAGIYGLNGAKWAASSGFNVSATEVKNLLAGLSDNSKLQTSGVVVAGTKYLLLRASDRSIYGKKGATGVCVVKTGKAVIVGQYDESIQPGSCNSTVEALADYLINAGY